MAGGVAGAVAKQRYNYNYYHGNNTHLKNEGNGLNTGNFSDDSLYDVTSIIIGYYHAMLFQPYLKFFHVLVLLP